MSTNALIICNTSIRQFNGLYSLNDLHRAAGGEKKHQPANFLRVDQIKELIKEIERSSDMRIALKRNHGGAYSGTYACKELVIAYGAWIRATIHLAVIRAFLNQQMEEKSMLTKGKKELTPPAVGESRILTTLNNGVTTYSRILSKGEFVGTASEFVDAIEAKGFSFYRSETHVVIERKAIEEAMVVRDIA